LFKYFMFDRVTYVLILNIVVTFGIFALKKHEMTL